MDSTKPEMWPEALAALIASQPELSERVIQLEAEGLGAVWRKYLAGADRGAVARFLEQVKALDWEHIRRHREALRLFREGGDVTGGEYEPLRADPDQAAHGATDATLGFASLARGEWAVTVFAGGAGTRFFSEWPRIHEALPVPSERMRTSPPDGDDPKGLFPISPVMGLSFVQRILAVILETGLRCGTLPPALFMTSRVTHQRFVDWLEDDSLWGFPKQALRLFRQPEIPRLDEEGDLLVSPDGELFWTGNGHGGVYGALELSGEDGLSARGLLGFMRVGHIVMGNVDNAALCPLEPARLGYHLRTKAAMTLSVVRRTDPDEKVGMTALRKDTGRVEVIEYSVLDPELSASPDGKGGLRFDGAHINTNLLSLSAMRSDLPGTLYTGKPVSVGQGLVNSSTYEFLNQHLASLLEPAQVRVYEAPRQAVFMPTKAVVGKDSVQTTVRELLRQSTEILRSLGARIAGDATSPAAMTEWHPCLGLTLEELKNRGLGTNWQLESGSRLYLGVRHACEAPKPYGSGLHLGEGASLIVDAELPYGVLAYCPQTRRISESPQSAGRLCLGEGVVLKPGVRVSVRIEGDGCLTIPDGTVFSEHVACRVAAGEHRVLSG